MVDMPFAYSIHPGEILPTEFMQPLDLSAYRLAKDIHVSVPRVNDLVRGKRAIAADTTLRLATCFGNSAENDCLGCSGKLQELATCRCFVSGHDLSRAERARRDLGFSPWGDFLRFPTHRLS